MAKLKTRLDVRVTELEKEVCALHSLLKNPSDATQEKHPESPLECGTLGTDKSASAALPTSFANITAGDSQPSLHGGHGHSATQTTRHNTIPLLKGRSSTPRNPANAAMSSWKTQTIAVSTLYLCFSMTWSTVGS